LTSAAPNADTASTRPVGISGGLPTLLVWLAFVCVATFIVFFGGALPFVHIPAARIAVQLIANDGSIVSDKGRMNFAASTIDTRPISPSCSQPRLVSSNNSAGSRRDSPWPVLAENLP
jgi:hypothetical protein